MTATTDVTLINNTNRYQFLFRGVSSFQPKKTQSVISIPFIATNPSQNFLFRFSGQVEELTFTFAIFNDGVDIANSSYTSSITTVDTQITYLKNIIFTDEISTYWTLTESRYFPTGINGVITDISFDSTAGSSTLVTGTLTFIRGFIADV